MSARRNSPRVDQLGSRAAQTVRTALTTLAGMSPAPKQSEMGGMETSASITLLASVQRQEQARKEKPSKEDLFDFQLRSYGLPQFVRQYPFAKSVGRRWLFDFANEVFKLAIEIEGLDVRVVGNPQRKSGREFIVGGRHATVDGIQEDMVKYNTATLLGWSLLRFSQRMVKSGEAIEMTQKVLYARGWKR